MSLYSSQEKSNSTTRLSFLVGHKVIQLFHCCEPCFYICWRFFQCSKTNVQPKDFGTILLIRKKLMNENLKGNCNPKHNLTESTTDQRFRRKDRLWERWNRHAASLPLTNIKTERNEAASRVPMFPNQPPQKNDMFSSSQCQQGSSTTIHLPWSLI